MGEKTQRLIIIMAGERFFLTSPQPSPYQGREKQTPPPYQGGGWEGVASPLVKREIAAAFILISDIDFHFSQFFTFRRAFASDQPILSIPILLILFVQFCTGLNFFSSSSVGTFEPRSFLAARSISSSVNLSTSSSSVFPCSFFASLAKIFLAVMVFLSSDY